MSKDFTPRHYFFIGVAGTGMSALAQYLAMQGHTVSGSDRYFSQGNAAGDIRRKLEALRIQCFPQDGSGMGPAIDTVVITGAVEETNAELLQARRLGLQVCTRSELLARLSLDKKTIAVAGTSGKSTTSALLFHLLQECGAEPSIISGAGLVSLQQQGYIGNAWAGKGSWLVIEADESDGSIINYHPYLGLLLNIDKDHKEIEELKPLFERFKTQSRHFSTNASHPLAAAYSADPLNDFGHEGSGAGTVLSGFAQEGLKALFYLNGQPCELPVPGLHNAENACAAVAAALNTGISLERACTALKTYPGIYRRNQVLGRKKGVWVVDDYAHNPAKVAAAIRGVQPLCRRVVAWFQPHGYGPTRFLRNDFVAEIAAALRPVDEIWMSEIFYAGGTAVKDISAADLIADLKALGCQAFFEEDRHAFAGRMKEHLKPGDLLLLMGARDPSLEMFAAGLYRELPD